jgi:hypothetical protein
MSNRPFAQLQAAAIDGRTRTVFYRQAQLEKLHKKLVADASEIVDAIIADSGLSRTEAQVEFSLALTAVRERFAELEPKKELEEEYAIARGEDAGSLRLGYGTVYIKASADHTPFYSAIAPLSAAIAAGNCVVLQVRDVDIKERDPVTDQVPRLRTAFVASQLSSATHSRLLWTTTHSISHNNPYKMHLSWATACKSSRTDPSTVLLH